VNRGGLREVMTDPSDKAGQDRQLRLPGTRTRQSLMRCFNSQTRSAASKSAFVRVRVPAAAISRSGWACAVELVAPVRERPRLCVFDLRPRRLAEGLADSLALFIIIDCNQKYGN